MSRGRMTDQPPFRIVQQHKREYFYSYKNRTQIQRGRKTRKISAWKESFPTLSSGVTLQIQDYRDLKLDIEKQKLTKPCHQFITALLFTLPRAICNKALGQLLVLLIEVLQNYLTMEMLKLTGRTVHKEITKTCYKENVFLSSHVLVSVLDKGTQFSVKWYQIQKLTVLLLLHLAVPSKPAILRSR